MITLGGNAELELVDTMDPFAEGVTFSVMPPKKSWRNIANLSGGEKVRLKWLLFTSWAESYSVDPEFSCPCFRSSRLQGEKDVASLKSSRSRPSVADPVVFYGRNRRRTWLPKRLHCCQLHQGPDQERTVHHHFPQVYSKINNIEPILNCHFRNDMFELSHRLIGIYKTANATQSA